jgi:Holliday junction resolvase
MREKEFEKQVKEYLRGNGCWVLKTWSNGVQREGVPDLLVCCNGYFLGVEVKAENGHPSELQLKNIQWIRKAYGIAIVLYPNQFEEFQYLIRQLLNEGLHFAAYVDQKRFDKEEYLK